MVAEKRAVCRFLGVWERILSISGRKPMSSISSASSNTTVRRVSNRRVPRLRWSSTRPGVPNNYVSCTGKRANLLGYGLSSVASHDPYAAGTGPDESVHRGLASPTLGLGPRPTLERRFGTGPPVPPRESRKRPFSRCRLGLGPPHPGRPRGAKCTLAEWVWVPRSQLC